VPERDTVRVRARRRSKCESHVEAKTEEFQLL